MFVQWDQLGLSCIHFRSTDLIYYPRISQQLTWLFQIRLFDGKLSSQIVSSEFTSFEMKWDFVSGELRAPAHLVEAKHRSSNPVSQTQISLG